jgi:hypothetical protein
VVNTVEHIEDEHGDCIKWCPACLRDVKADTLRDRIKPHPIRVYHEVTPGAYRV